MVKVPPHFVESLDSIQFPASKYEVVLKAEALGADNAMIRRLLNLPSDIYSGREHLNRELARLGLRLEAPVAADPGTDAADSFNPAQTGKVAAGNGSRAG